MTVGCMCTGYLVLLAVVFGGLLQPAAKPAPGKADPLPDHTSRPAHRAPRGPGPSATPDTSGRAVPVGHHTSRAPSRTTPAP